MKICKKCKIHKVAINSRDGICYNCRKTVYGNIYGNKRKKVRIRW